MSQSFTDGCGDGWTVDVTVTSIKRVRAALDVDLMELVEGDLIQRLITDPILLVDVVYVLCEQQAEKRGLTDEQFGERMAGDVIDRATNAFLEAVVAFTPSPRDRKTLGRVVEATQTAMDRARDIVEQRIDGGELERAMDQALERAGVSSTGPPASSELTPDR